LFVPLAGKPYDWFSSRRKTWELRRCRGPWSTENVRTGRRVELRRGYRDRASSLWGTVEETLVAPGADAFFDLVPYPEVIPDAVSRAAAVAQFNEILGVDSSSVEIIGFRVVLDDENAVRELPLAEEYRDSLLLGAKTTTVRLGRREYVVGPARIVFRSSPSIPVIVSRVEHLRVADLTREIAVSDGFRNQEELLNALLVHYPEMREDDVATVVHFQGAPA